MQISELPITKYYQHLHIFLFFDIRAINDIMVYQLLINVYPYKFDCPLF